jgi:hypothetical protein
MKHEVEQMKDRQAELLQLQMLKVERQRVQEEENKVQRRLEKVEQRQRVEARVEAALALAGLTGVGGVPGGGDKGYSAGGKATADADIKGFFFVRRSNSDPFTAVRSLFDLRALELLVYAALSYECRRP